MGAVFDFYTARLKALEMAIEAHKVLGLTSEGLMPTAQKIFDFSQTEGGWLRFLGQNSYRKARGKACTTR